MKYLGEEKAVEIKTVIERPIQYIRCDKCGKKILPYRYAYSEGQYVHVHTWHNDWGSESIESHEHHDYCVECAKEIVAEYITNMAGSEELELSNEYLAADEKYRGSVSRSDGYALAATDKRGINIYEHT